MLRNTVTGDARIMVKLCIGLLNLSAIEQSAAELLQFEYLTLNMYHVLRYALG